MSAGNGFLVAGSLAFGVATGAVMLPAAFPRFTRRYCQQYKKNNDPETVDDHTLGLVTKVLTKMQMPAEKEKQLDLFVSKCEPEYHGSLAFRYSVLLGLPPWFKWRTEEDMDEERNRLFKPHFPWSHPLANDVKAALVLTDSEKEFVIARQLGYLDNKNVLMRLGFRSICMLTAFLSAHFLNSSLGLYKGHHKGRAVTSKKPMRTAAGVYIAMSLVAYVVYVPLSDWYACYLDRWADKYAATISPEFSLAGYNYYNKTLKRNIALRQILPEGEKQFTAYGNEVTGVFRTRHIPLVSRRDRMKKIHDQQTGSIEQPQGA